MNVCGINSKVNFGILLDYSNNFDILCLSETKTDEINLLNNFITYNAKKVSEKHRYSGVHGLQIYIREELSANCTLLQDKDLQSNFIMWVKVFDSFILGNCYIPHEASKHYQVDLFDDIAIDICCLKSKFDMPIILTGDLNSRTGSLEDFILEDLNNDPLNDLADITPMSSAYILEDQGIPLRRYNCDAGVNNNGRRIIELCRVHDLSIMNGRVGADRGVGAFTCADASVIDYVIASPQLFKHVQKFEIDKFDSLLSDKHCPVNVTLHLNKP